MAKERKSPQEKKDLEYTRDRHAFARHSDKGLRLARPRRKAAINREYRHKVDTVVRQAVKNDVLANEPDITNKFVSKGIFRKRLWKVAPPTLKDAIARKAERRERRDNRKSTKAEKSYREGVSAIETLARMDAVESLKFLDLLNSYSQHIFKRPEQRDAMWSTATWVLYLNQGDPSQRRFLEENPDWAGRYQKIVTRLNKLESNRQRREPKKTQKASQP